jgi:methylmalonyl-CoA mutase N-terminal domain/subunit
MAFDRHMNVVLGDAEEFRVVRVRKPGGGGFDEREEKRALDRIREDAREGRNVMPSLVDASLGRCTLGEMVQAMADVYGRYAGGPEW